MDKRDDIIRKITALKLKTVERGCTEEEAMAASNLANKLLTQYNLTLTEVDVREEGSCVTRPIDTGRKNLHPVSRVVPAIAALTNTKSWYVPGSTTSTLTISFFGFKHDTLVAEMLYHIALNAMDVAGRKAAQDGYHRSSFLRGMADRMSKTLMSMKAQEDMRTESASNAVLVIKERVVNQEFEKTALTVKVKRATKHDEDYFSYTAGMRSGANVSFVKGVC